MKSLRLTAQLMATLVALGSMLLVDARADAQCNLLQNARQANASATCSGSGCRFGGAVAVSADGNTAIVGAYGDNSNGGSAIILVRSGSSWTQQGTKLVPTGGSGMFQYFGCSVALSTDGNTAVIGAYADANSVGAVYVFTRTGTTWTQQGAKLVPTSGIGPQQYFGFAVSVSGDGNTALIGAKGDNSYTGAAYIFTRSGTTWAQAARLLATGGSGFSTFFGTAVSLSGDGNTAIVGAEGDSLYLGAAYIFVRAGTMWNQQGKLLATGGVGTTLYFGTSVAISNDGNTAIIGAYADNATNGAASVFVRSGTTWMQQQRLQPTGAVGQGKFGWSVAISREGTTALVGAKSDNGSAGAGYVYTRSGTVWTQQGTKLTPTGAASLGEFATAVSLGSSGNIGIIGAPSESIGAGANYSFWRGCPADFNCSGSVNVADIFSFLSAWFAMDARANFNGVGGITVADIFAFLGAWFAPC